MATPNSAHPRTRTPQRHTRRREPRSPLTAHPTPHRSRRHSTVGFAAPENQTRVPHHHPGHSPQRTTGPSRRTNAPNAPNAPKTGPTDASTPNSPTQSAATGQDPGVGCWRPPVTSAPEGVCRRTPHRRGVGLHILRSRGWWFRWRLSESRGALVEARVAGRRALAGRSHTATASGRVADCLGRVAVLRRGGVPECGALQNPSIPLRNRPFWTCCHLGTGLPAGLDGLAG